MTKERLSLKETQEKDIIVRNSGIIEFQFVEDPPDGNLAIAQGEKDIPFPIKRTYWINKLNRPEAVRGKHAHIELEQVIVCLNGSFTLHLDDGAKKQDIIMDSPYRGVILGKMLWHKMTDFSKDCVILVLAGDVYKEADYIRNYEDFLARLAQ